MKTEPETDVHMPYEPGSSGEDGWWWQRDGGRVTVEVREVEDRLASGNGTASRTFYVACLCVALLLVVLMNMVLSLVLLPVAAYFVWKLVRGKHAPLTANVTKMTLEADKSGVLFSTNSVDPTELLSQRGEINTFNFSAAASSAGAVAVPVAAIEAITAAEFGDGTHLAIVNDVKPVGLFLPVGESDAEQVAAALRQVTGLA